jgi:2-polyprenyl-6-methoxyphenol hydroxylase-like FAD-dependent oxidoreductase
MLLELDVLIVGGGIAGLYCAYLCRKYRPEWRMLVVEKNPTVGGRMGTYSFHGVPVATGAGIGRQKKDKRLQRLLHTLQIPTTAFTAGNGFSAELSDNNLCHVKELYAFLKETYRQEEEEQQQQEKDKTFKEFAQPLLGAKAYRQFVVCAGYSDYERAGAADVFAHYGFEDNYAPFAAIGVPWQRLLDQLVGAIGARHILTGAKVVRIEPLEEEEEEEEASYLVKANDGSSYRCRKVVLATTVEVVRRLLPSMNIYKQIHAQPFLRIYGKFTKASIARMKEYMRGQRTVVVTGPIHKIITINEAAGVYMIAYTDNAGALALKKYKEARLCRLLEKALSAPPNTLNLVSMVSFYWPVGTHYYGPLKFNTKTNTKTKTRAAFIRAAQRPRKNLFVGGEMLSLHQGWVEGALESIDRIRADLFL